MIKNVKGGANTKTGLVFEIKTDLKKLEKDRKRLMVLNCNIGKLSFYNISKFWSSDRIENFLFSELNLSESNTTWSIIKK